MNELQAAATTGEQQRGRTRILVGLMMAMSIAAIDSTIVATSIPAIVRELGGYSIFAWVFSAYVLAQAVTIPIYGRLADLFGRRPVLVVGVAIFLAGSMLCGVATSMEMLILFRAVQGIGAGAITPIVFTIVGDLYHGAERGRVQGWVSSVWGACAILGPAIGGFFSDFIWWRWIFYINVPLGLLALILVLSTFHERAQRQAHRIDVLGSALLAIGMGAVIFGLLAGGIQWPWLSAPSFLVFGAGIAALAAFVWQENRAPEPAVPLWILRNRVLIGCTAASAIIGILAVGLIIVLPTYAQRVLGLAAVPSGFLLAAMSVTWSVGSVASAWIYPRVGHRNNAVIGVAVAVVATIGFALNTESTPLWVLAVSSAMLGLGLGMISTPLIIGLQSAVQWEQRGLVTGAFTFAQQMGQAVGAALFSSVANAALIAWFASAPADLVGRVPSSLSAASDAIAAGSGLDPSAVRYVNEGIALATHQVFVGLVVVAAVGLLILLWTPSRFDRLDGSVEMGGGPPGREPS